MRELGHLNNQFLQRIDTLEEFDRPSKKIEDIALDRKHKRTIEEILDKVENGDLSILDELGILYTKTTTKKGKTRISFKYEGIKYTVIINANEDNKTGGTTGNTKTVRNDDGSYTIYEYDANGDLIKSTDYDKDGKITHEYMLKEDGSHSDKYYTYENGKLIQVQETIHYPDGNYTYIFTDGNGKVKEIQKVIHNDLGGLTFDITNEDGKRHVMTNDANGNLVNDIFYSSDGKVEKTKEYSYDQDNPNLYTVITKNAEGHVIDEENWENYSFTDNEGRTWYGSRMLRKIDFDTNGNILGIIHIDYKDYYSSEYRYINSNDEQFLEELKNLAKDFQDQLDNVSRQIRSLDVPVPPNAIDFKKSSDGSIDEDAYNKAMQKYNKQLVAYHKKVDELNKKSMEIQNKLQQIEKQITELELKARIETVENTINDLKAGSNIDSELISLLETTLENIKKSLIDLPNKKLELQNKLQNVYSQILNLPIPTPPSAGDFMKPDGSIDEEAYAEAFANYEYQKHEYDIKHQKLMAEASRLHGEIAKIDMDIQKQTNELNQLEKNVNAVKTIQDLINGIEDKENNKDLISQLNKMLEDLSTNIKNQNEVRQLIDDLYDKLMNEDMPNPPSTSDYVTQDGVLDEPAYAQAFAEYQKAMDELTEKMEQYNTNVQIASNGLSDLNNQVNNLLFNAMVAVTENKIAQLKNAGKDQEANNLENRLNNLKNEFNYAQNQRKALLDAENSLLTRLNSIHVPNMPSANDYKMADGSIDEFAYEQALKIYEKQKNKYDSVVNNIHEQLNKFAKLLNDVNEKISQIIKDLSELI